ncbi:hypothetical protein [Solihabitans fulvus]|uniref:hypothetical protein n=1 Tax=Solihabitans fulvus TaxID=1892852 RepID=UPI001CB75CB8|nr:hypothetical protein [Solihabitans fulvus]
MTRPPSQPANAAASWKPAALTASVGAVSAAVSTRVCMPGTIANARVPSVKVRIAAGAGLSPTSQARARMPARAASRPVSAGIRARSASRPPRTLPSAVRAIANWSRRFANTRRSASTDPVVATARPATQRATRSTA